MVLPPSGSTVDSVLNIVVSCHVKYYHDVHVHDDCTYKRLTTTAIYSQNIFFSMLTVYLGAGIRAWTAMRKRRRIKEQTRLVLNVSSLI